MEKKVKKDCLNLSDSDFTYQLLFLVWLKIGGTSFGGGAVTQYLIQENFIYKHKWITEEEYANIIGMCQITPGINIIAYTIVIGKQLAGWWGIIISVAGLILPSAAITVIISAIYANISQYTEVQSGLRTAFAAIFGVSLATNWRNVKPILLQNKKRGSLAFAVVLAILFGSGLIYIFFDVPVAILYLFGGVCGAFSYRYISKRKQEV
ncbi:MAG: chromate transporter [Selenomonadaceae bacterium]